QRDVYGLSWQVRGDPPAVDEMHVWHVMGRDELARTTPEAMRSKYGRLDGGFAQALLHPALGPALLAHRGSWGIMIAPDGPLWMTRWEQVRFDPRPVEGLDSRGNADPLRVSRLWEIVHSDKPALRKAGIWCVPSLGAQALAPGDGLTLQLG